MNIQDRAMQGAEASAEAAEKTAAATQDALRRGADAAASQQAKMLDSLQSFSQGWIERRQTAAQAALEATQKFWTAQSPTDAMAAYQTWAKGAVERSMADAAALQQHMAQLAGQTVETARAVAPQR